MRQQYTACIIECVTSCRYTVERPPLLHRQLMSVFVSAGLISAPGTPCKNQTKQDLGKQVFHTHTHEHTHTQTNTNNKHKQTHTHTHKKKETQKHTRNTHTHTNTHTQTHTKKKTQEHTKTHTHTNTHTQTPTHTHTQTHTHTHSCNPPSFQHRGVGRGEDYGLASCHLPKEINMDAATVHSLHN